MAIEITNKSAEYAEDAEESAEAAALSETNAASSETSAATSETNASGSETNASGSATDAEGYASDAADSAEEASSVVDLSAANVTWDFVAPFNDSLQITKGFGTADQIDVSAAQDDSIMVDLPTKSVDFSRASSAWGFNKSGILTEFGEDEIAIGTDGASIYESVTNVIPYSSDMSTWTSSNITPATDTQLALDNESLTYKLVEDVTTSSSHSSYYAVSSQVAGSYAISACVKASGRSQLRFSQTRVVESYAVFDLSTGEVVSSSEVDGSYIEHIRDDWYRCSIWFTTSTDIALVAAIYLMDAGSIVYDGDGLSGLYVSDVNLTNTAFLAPPIPTDGSAVTKSADILSVQAEGNLPPEGDSFAFVADASFNDDSAIRMVMRLGTSSTLGMYIARRTDKTLFFLLADESGDASVISTSTIDDDTVTRIIAAYSKDTNSISIYINGVIEGTTELSGSPVYSISDDIYIGMDSQSIRWINGTIKNLKIIQDEFSASNAAALGSAE